MEILKLILIMKQKSFKENQPSIVINLDQAGEEFNAKPSEYVKSNLVGFANILQESIIMK